MTPLRVLHIEDRQEDVELAMLQLRRTGYEPAVLRVDDAPGMSQALREAAWDLVLSDCSMPEFGALDALRLLHDSGQDLPFVIVSGTIAEETAAAAMRAGAHDFVRKDKLAQLGPVVDRELRERAAREVRRRANEELKASEAMLRALVDACPLPLWAFEPRSAALLLVNEAAQKYAPREGESVGTLVDVGDDPSRKLAQLSSEAWLDLGITKETAGGPAVAVEARLVEVENKTLALATAALRSPPTPSNRPSLGPTHRSALDAKLDRALGGLWIAFQPIVSWSDRRVIGYEALVRSAEPTVPNPAELFSLAEKAGRLHELSGLIRARIAEAGRSAPAGALLFVNVHSEDLNGLDLFLATAPLAALARQVVLEITERASLHGVRDVGTRLARLRALGYQIAVDDLGAGYSGLSSFSQLEPDVVKLDMSLVRGIDESPRKRSVVRSLLSLAAKELGMFVICEGVETPAERDTLVALGADLLQGYLFAKPTRGFVVPSL